MARALSIDLRQRALAMYDDGLGTIEVARRLKVSPAWARRQKQRRREGRPIEPGTGSGRRPLLDDAARVTLYRWVGERPDATIAELRERCRAELGIAISVGATWNALRAGRFTLKKSRNTPPSNSARTSRPHATRS